MTRTRTSSACLLLCLASVVAGAPAVAQSGGAGPLRERLQDRVQSEIDRKAADSRAQIQQQMAARPSPAEIAYVRQVQTALNYFAFKAGPVDGLMGKQTRSAIEAYQVYIDDPATGKLTEAQSQLLLMSYQQAQANGAQARRVAETHPDGIKGWLLIVRDGAEKPVTSVIPNFRTTGGQQDLSAFCAQPAVGSTTDASAPSLDTLGPLFCAARGAAIAQSEEWVANVTGFTKDEIDMQCVGFEPALASLVASVSDAPAGDVIEGAAEFVKRTGQDPAEMSDIAKVCLGVGYRRDQLNLVIGSAVILTALDELTYAEYAGYHLALGFGTTKDAAEARKWFEIAMQGESDSSSTFEIQASERLETLKRISMQSGDDGSTSAIPVPSFSVNE